MTAEASVRSRPWFTGPWWDQDRMYDTVPELPVHMAQPTGRGRFRPLVQFARDWGRRNDGDRTKMIADPPPEGTDEITAAKIAMVVHALCDRDGFEIPNWVWRHRAPVEMSIIDDEECGLKIHLDTVYGRELVAQSCPASKYHRVYMRPAFLKSSPEN